MLNRLKSIMNHRYYYYINDVNNDILTDINAFRTYRNIK